MANSQTTGKHILLVDDDADLAQLLSFVLRQASFEVRYVPDVKQAMKEVADGQLFDLFILDLWMPELDGEHLLRWLREEQKVTKPIMMLTGTVRPGIKEQLKSAGADAVVHKPLDIQTLNTLVQELLK